jgi:hypothetical protein
MSEKKLLVVSVGVTLALYAIPFGRFVAYPLLLLSTLVHELGHGVTAALTGASFDSFHMYWNGSGVAHWSPVASTTKGDVALIAAGGLCGPAILAAICFTTARWRKAARPAFGVLGALALLAEILVVRNGFGIVFVAAVIAACGWIAIRGTPDVARTALVFLGAQLAVSVFSRGDYLFMAKAHTSDGVMPSDVKLMELAVGGPYWMWGFLCGAISLVVLALGAWLLLWRRAAKTPLSKIKIKTPAVRTTAT